MEAIKFAEQFGINKKVISSQHYTDRKIGRTDRFKKDERGRLWVESERYFTRRDYVSEELTREIEETYFKTRELFANDNEMAWTLCEKTGISGTALLQRFRYFKWRKDSDVLRRLLTAMKEFIRMDEKARRSEILKGRARQCKFSKRSKNANS